MSNGCIELAPGKRLLITTDDITHNLKLEFHLGLVTCYFLKAGFAVVARIVQGLMEASQGRSIISVQSVTRIDETVGEIRAPNIPLWRSLREVDQSAQIVDGVGQSLCTDAMESPIYE